MVESMIRYSKSGLSINALNMRSQTPFLAQRRKRWKTLFQLPNDGGRSRQGAPARAIQSTASTNRRLSSPCRPLSPCLPVTNGSMRRHCAFVNCRRIKITPSVAILNHIREPEGIPYMSTGPSITFGEAGAGAILPTLQPLDLLFYASYDHAPAAVPASTAGTNCRLAAGLGFPAISMPG